MKLLSVVTLLSLICLPVVNGQAEAQSSRAPQDILNRAQAFETAKQYDKAITAYREYLTLIPEDDRVRGGLARLLSWEGQYDEAVLLYQGLLHRHPEDLDFKVALARVTSWQKKFAEALLLYESVLRKDPKNLEAKQGLADILYWTGDYAKALRAYEELALATPDPEIRRRIRAIQSELADLNSFQILRAPVGQQGPMPSLPFRDYLKVGYTHYTYTNQFPDERDWRVEAAKSLGAQTLVGRIEPMNRFGFHDTPVSAELYSPLWRKAWGYLAGSAAVNPHFVPNLTAGGEVYQGLGVVHRSLAFLEGSLGYRHMQFKSTNIELIIPGLIIYLPYNMWLTEKVYYVPDTGSASLASQLTWRPTDRVQIFGSGAFGTSGERIVAVQDFIRVSTRIIQGGVIFPLSQYLSCEAMGYYEDRATLYIRRGGTVNLILHW